MAKHHFASIGFTAPGRGEVVDLLRRAAREGVAEALTDGDRYVRYVDEPSGAQVNLVVGPDGQIRSAKPSFRPADPRQVVARVTGLHPDPGNPHGDLVQLAPVAGDYPLAVELEEGARAATQLPFGDEATFEILALADALEVYADEAAFRASGMPLGVEALIPSGLFPVSSADGYGRPRAAAIFTGRVLDVRAERNERGGAAFFHLVVRTFGMDIDVAVSPTAIEGPTPAPGMVISGSFWMVARLADGRPAPARTVVDGTSAPSADVVGHVPPAAAPTMSDRVATTVARMTDDRIGRQRLFGRWTRG
jgi:hypothetical protein